MGPHDAWHGAAYAGRLSGPDGAVPALVLLGPEGAAGDALSRARASASRVLAMRADGVLPLLAVERLDSRVAWVHEYADGIGLVHTVGAEGQALLPTRAVAEAIARIAEILLQLGPEGHKNRGPEPTDVLLDREGRLFVAGFAGPFPVSPSMRAPKGEEGEAGAVYRLGVLMAHLLSGVAPPAASERGAHASLVRRALIRAMARPGPVLSERYADWLRGMLAWEASSRPPLSTLPEGLRQVAQSMGGETLAAWAARNVDPLREQVRRRPDSDRGLADEPTDLHPSHPSHTSGDSLLRPRAPESAPTPTIGGPRLDLPQREQDFLDDDPTQEAASLSLAPRIGGGPVVRMPTPSSIPVYVGPPPEAMKEPPSLPREFLGEQDENVATDATQAGPSIARIAVFVLWLCVIFVLAATALVFTVYLLVVPAHTSAPAHADGPEPTLQDALPPGTSAPPSDATGAPAPSGAIPPDAGTPTDVAAPSVTTDAPADDAAQPVDGVTPGEGTPTPSAGTSSAGTSPETAPSSGTTSTATSPGTAPSGTSTGTTPSGTTSSGTPAGPFEVTFRSADGASPLDVRCNGDVGGSGVGTVRLVGLSPGPCVVTSTVAGQTRRAAVALTGPTTLTCFADNSRDCR